MAEFSVMINLGKADLDDYSLLAKMLRKTGFSETKAAQVAADYRLLPASCRYSSETENMNAVRDKALKSSNSVSSKAMVLVSECRGGSECVGAQLAAHKVSVVRGCRSLPSKLTCVSRHDHYAAAQSFSPTGSIGLS